MTIIGSLFLLASLNAQEPNVIHNFTFKDFAADTPIRLGKDAIKSCDKTDYGYSCDNLYNEMAGWRSIVIVQLSGGYLSNITVTGFRNAIPDVLAALRAKYGVPCSTKVNSVKNRAGNEFSSREFVWCFKSGKMTFMERGFKIDRYSLTYKDEKHQKPARQPIVDF